MKRRFAVALTLALTMAFAAFGGASAQELPTDLPTSDQGVQMAMDIFTQVDEDVTAHLAEALPPDVYNLVVDLAHQRVEMMGVLD